MARRILRMVEYKHRIDRAAPRSSWQPIQRRQPHTRVQAFPISYRAHTRAASQVRHDYVDIGTGLAEVRGHAGKDGGVREAVGAVFAEWDRGWSGGRREWVCVYMWRDGLVEEGVEKENLAGFWKMLKAG